MIPASEDQVRRQGGVAPALLSATSPLHGRFPAQRLGMSTAREDPNSAFGNNSNAFDSRARPRGAKSCSRKWRMKWEAKRALGFFRLKRPGSERVDVLGLLGRARLAIVPQVREPMSGKITRNGRRNQWERLMGSLATAA
jgi:hypothetical protein